MGRVDSVEADRDARVRTQTQTELNTIA